MSLEYIKSQIWPESVSCSCEVARACALCKINSYKSQNPPRQTGQQIDPQSFLLPSSELYSFSTHFWSSGYCISFSRPIEDSEIEIRYRGRDSNPHGTTSQRILSPLRLPFRHPGRRSQITNDMPGSQFCSRSTQYCLPLPPLNSVC